MEISQLTELFEVTHYRPCGKSATLELHDDGGLVIAGQYKFYADNRQLGPNIFVNAVVTPQQNDDLKAILADVLQATNAEIENVTGWTKFTQPEPD